MKLILKANSSEDYSGDCDYALLELTPERVDHLLQRHREFCDFRKKTGAYEAYWFDSQVTFFTPFPMEGYPSVPENTEHAKLLEKMVDRLKNGREWAKVPESFEVKDLFQPNTECDQLITREDGVAFFCYPKHCTVQVTTELVPVAVLREARRGKR